MTHPGCHPCCRAFSSKSHSPLSPPPRLPRNTSPTPPCVPAWSGPSPASSAKSPSCSHRCHPVPNTRRPRLDRSLAERAVQDTHRHVHFTEDMIRERIRNATHLTSFGMPLGIRVLDRMQRRKIVGNLRLANDRLLFVAGLHARGNLFLQLGHVAFVSGPLHIGLTGRKPHFANEDVFQSHRLAAALG